MIDCDVHCGPASWEALSPYLAASWREYITSGGIPFPSTPSHAYPPAVATSAVPEARDTGLPAVPASYEQLSGQLLDRSSPSYVVLNCLTMFNAIRNPYFQAGLATALNDWLRGELLDRDPRLRASIVVPWADPAGAAVEIERLADDRRFVQVLLPIRAERPWGHKTNHAIFDAAADSGVAICLHAWGMYRHSSTPSGLTSSYVEDYLSNPVMAQQQVLNLIAEGIFVRHPGLQVVVAESGFAWLPPLLWRADKHWRSFWPEVPWVKDRPSRYVREHVRLTTSPAHLSGATAAETRELVDMIGPSRLLYASDYPHDHGSSSKTLIEALDSPARDAVLSENAATLYGLVS